MLKFVYLCICLAWKSRYIADRGNIDFSGLDKLQSYLRPRCQLTFIPPLSFEYFLLSPGVKSSFSSKFLSCNLLFKTYHNFSKRGLCLCIPSSQPQPSFPISFNLSTPISIFTKDLSSGLSTKSHYKILQKMSIPTSGEPLGDVLVVGGCGFLGHHVVRELLADPSCSSISVMSRSPFKNRYDGVKYYMCV